MTSLPMLGSALSYSFSRQILLHVGFLLSLFFDRENGGDVFLSVYFEGTTLRYIPEDRTLHT
jgi:hypothetical protein